MKRPALIGLLVAAALLVLVGVVGATGRHTGGTARPATPVRVAADCGGCG